MNKFTLLAIAGLLSFNVQAQVERVKVSNSTPETARPQTGFRHVSQNPVARGGISAINVAYSDDFSLANDTNGLKARGYLPYYRGAGPVGTTPMWFQGNAVNWPAYNGADTSYVFSNYNSVTGANDIDNWLVLPALNVASGDVISFYSRSFNGSTFPDSIKVMYSAAGDSVPEGTSWVMLGEFEADITGNWVQSVYTAPAAGATARFAIRYAVVDGGPNGANSNGIGIDQLDVLTPAAVDGGVSAITSLADGCGLSATSSVTITIINNGAAALTSVPVSFTVNSGTPVSETFTGNIAPFSSATYTFTGTADLSTPGTAYTITATTNLTGDGNASNDASSVIVNNVAPTAVLAGTPFTEGFESVAIGAVPPTGWSSEDTDGDASNWDFAGTLANSGTMCARIGFGGGNPVANAENWLFTPCLDLVTGVNYQLNYYYKSFDNTATSYEIETRFGTSAVGTSMTNNIAAEPLFPDDVYHLASHTFTVSANGTYYVGFNGFGAAPQVSLRVDDIEITAIVGVKDVTLENSVKIAPNPSSGLVTVSSKLNDKVSLSVYNNIGQEVASYNFDQAFKTQLDLSSFANGIYTIRLSSANQSVVNKVVLSK